ncbi:hypothetical protein H8697_00860 [[Eubacterium] tenue]|nr:hypothetical protein [[Eubacterium] tenue]MBC8630260.1 hypothetical protein [[Eubacterium] tenue]
MLNNETRIIKEDEKITTILGPSQVVVSKKMLELKINDKERLEVKDILLKSSQISNSEKIDSL